MLQYCESEQKSKSPSRMTVRIKYFEKDEEIPQNDQNLRCFLNQYKKELYIVTDKPINDASPGTTRRKPANEIFRKKEESASRNNLKDNSPVQSKSPQFQK